MKTINLAAGTTHVQYDELAKLIAYAQWPDDGSMDVELFEMSRVGAEINLDAELKQAVTMGRLPVKDPLTFGPHTFPLGRALKTSMVAIGDVRAFAADRGVTVVVEATQAKADTQPQAVTVEAVPVVTNNPLPVTTGDIAHAFDGLRGWSEEQWKKPLGDKPAWLVDCVVIPGVRGKSETRWNPVSIGAALVRNGHAKANNVRGRFQSKPQLKPWLDAWKTYEADNLDTV